MLDLRVLDAETDAPMACSVALWAPDGAIITPNPGSQKPLRTGGVLAHPLPSGKVRLIVTRGFDYKAEDRVLELTPGETNRSVVRLERVSPLRRDGWLCGDNHVHMKHDAGTITADFQYIALTARAEGLDYMSVAQRWSTEDVTPDFLSHATGAVSTPDLILHWNMEAPKNYWEGDVSHCMGHGWSLGVRDHGPADTNPIAELFAMSAGDYQKEHVPTPNFESHAYIHACGGVVAYTHPCRIWRGTWGGRNGFPVQQEKFVSNMAQELPFDTIAGPTYDSIDILMTTREHLVNELGQQLWFMLLNQGYRIAATASTDASFDKPAEAHPGSVRVYTRIQGEPSLDKVAAGMKAGRNFVTSGPLLEFTIGSASIGDVVPTSSTRHSARVRAWASGIPGEFLSRIEVLRNGEPYRTLPLTGKPRRHDATFDLAESQTSWYIVRCFGSNSDQVAISNPIYFEAPGYTAPEPALAGVKLQVVRAGTSEPLDAMYEVLQMVGRQPHVLSSGKVEGGHAALTVPATSRIRISAPGCAPVTKSIFIDSPEILNLTTEMQLAELLDWNTYEEIRRKLSDIRFVFEIQPNA